MRALVRHAVARLRVRWGRALLAAGGIAAASAMLGAAVTVASSCAAGSRGSPTRADMPDVIVHGSMPARSGTVCERVRCVAELAAVSYRYEERRVQAVVARPVAPRSPAVICRDVAGRGMVARSSPAVTCADGSGEAVVEQRAGRGVAPPSGGHGSDVRDTRPRSLPWQLRMVGDRGVSRQRGLPAGGAAPGSGCRTGGRPYFDGADAREPDRTAGAGRVHDRDRLDVTLEQARTASFGTRVASCSRPGTPSVVPDRPAPPESSSRCLVAFWLVALAGRW